MAINIKDHDSYYKIEVINPDGYPEWVKDLNARCIPKNDNREIMDYVMLIEEAGMSVNFIKFEKSNRRLYD